jgi:type II secretory pathway pseudopilin PulG
MQRPDAGQRLPRGTGRFSRRRTAVSLVETLIVLAIVTLLLQLALPAIQNAREAARRVQCLDHVRQLAAAAQVHLAAQGHFPAGGWSWQWVGDPARGAGPSQPGSWIYNSLPYLEQNAVHSLSADEVASRSLALLHCPSRREALPYPNTRRDPVHNAKIPAAHARSDYAANGGDLFTNLGRGPQSYAEADDPTFAWAEAPTRATGIFFCRSVVRAAEVVDGLSQTYLYGEKYLSSANYAHGNDDGDDGTMYQGDDMDIVRWTSPRISDAYKGFVDRPNLPRPDEAGFATAYAFGSAHPYGWHAARCDGSARLVDYGLDAEVHRRLGNRRDGELGGNSGLATAPLTSRPSRRVSSVELRDERRPSSWTAETSLARPRPGAAEGRRP